MAADPVLIDVPAPEPTQVRDGGRTRDFWADLSLVSLPELERELNLSPLQRERIQRWLVQQKEALEADIDQFGIIGQATHDAIRAELDYFQAQEFDRAWNARGYDVGIDLINRPSVTVWTVIYEEVEAIGYVTRESARLETYNLRAQTFHTLLRMDPMIRVGIDPMSDKLFKPSETGFDYRPAVEAMDQLETDLLDCSPFTGKQQFALKRSTK